MKKSYLPSIKFKIDYSIHDTAEILGVEKKKKSQNYLNIDNPICRVILCDPLTWICKGVSTESNLLTLRKHLCTREKEIGGECLAEEITYQMKVD